LGLWRTKKEKPMEMYCGIDLHATNSWLCVIDEEGRAQLEARAPNQQTPKSLIQ
jgi:predicted NBD/HSP70 family sugar kinase